MHTAQLGSGSRVAVTGPDLIAVMDTSVGAYGQPFRVYLVPSCNALQAASTSERIVVSPEGVVLDHDEERRGSPVALAIEGTVHGVTVAPDE